MLVDESLHWKTHYESLKFRAFRVAIAFNEQFTRVILHIHCLFPLYSLNMVIQFTHHFWNRKWTYRKVRYIHWSYIGHPPVVFLKVIDRFLGYDILFFILMFWSIWYHSFLIVSMSLSHGFRVYIIGFVFEMGR